MNRAKCVIPGLETNIVDGTYGLETVFLNKTTSSREGGEVVLLLCTILMDYGGYITTRLEV